MRSVEQWQARIIAVFYRRRSTKLSSEFVERAARLAFQEYDPMITMQPPLKVLPYGTYFAKDGSEVDALPADDKPMAIAGSPWPCQLKGIMQSRCEACGDLVALSPTSQRLLQEHSVVLINCRPCWYALQWVGRVDTEFGEKELVGVTQ